MDTKVCSRCGRALPVYEFNRRTDRPGRTLSHCRECRTETRRVWWQRKRQQQEVA